MNTIKESLAVAKQALHEPTIKDKAEADRAYMIATAKEVIQNILRKIEH